MNKLSTILAFISTAFGLTKATGVTVLDGKKAERKVIYLRDNAKGYGAGRKELVLSTTNEEVGVTNLENKDQLPTGINYLVKGIRATFAPSTDANVKSAKYGSDAGDSNFLNGEIRVEQDGTLLRLPIRAIATNGDTNKNLAAKDTFFELEAPFMIKDGKKFGISVEPTGAITVEQCFSIELDVIELSDSAKARN